MKNRNVKSRYMKKDMDYYINKYNIQDQNMFQQEQR